MTQRSAAGAAPTLLRHVRRLLVVLGGAFVWWLVVLAGGSAHAEGTGHVAPASAADQPTRHRVLVADVPAVLDGTTHRVTGTLRTVPDRVSGTLADATGRAPRPVRTTVNDVAAQVAPALALTTTHLADAVDHTVDTATATVAPVLAHAGLAASPGDPSAIAPAVVRPALDGSAAHPTHPRVAHRATDPSHTGVASTRHGVAAGRVGHAGNEPAQPARGDGSDAPALPGSGATSAAGGPALLGGLVTVLPALRRRRRERDDAAPPSGPAYAPGSSPD